MLGGDTTELADTFWQACSDEEWYQHHPASALRRQGTNNTVIPNQIYGDDIEMRNRQSALILTWSSMCCQMGTIDSEFLVTVLPLKDIDSTAMDCLSQILVWSMECLLSADPLS